MPSILVTAAAKRLGKYFAVEFAKLGYDIILHYNSSEDKAKQVAKEIEKLGRKCYLIQADLRSSEEVNRSFEKAFKDFQVPDILINNAGVFPERNKIENIDDDTWNEVFDVNLKASFYTSRAFAKFANEGSKIINIASLGGMEIWKNRIHYNVSKSALIQLTRALARELAPKISVNSVSPGAVDFESEKGSDEASFMTVDKIPMKRYATAADIFEAVRFFATCTNYISGQNLLVDGAYNCVK